MFSFDLLYFCHHFIRIRALHLSKIRIPKYDRATYYTSTFVITDCALDYILQSRPVKRHSYRLNVREQVHHRKMNINSLRNGYHNSEHVLITILAANLVLYESLLGTMLYIILTRQLLLSEFRVVIKFNYLR